MQSIDHEVLHDPSLQVATFAAGCFWCAQEAFEDQPGVKAVIAGYTGGTTEDPSYEDVLTETTGHREAVQVYFDPERTSFEHLLIIFWSTIDPTDAGGQLADRGESYTTAIFYHNDEQRRIAEQSKKDQQVQYSKPMVTKILPFKNFYIAEEYHQGYAKKHPVRYKLYKVGSGRSAMLKERSAKY
ncbi:peptide-methionine (S)-S-oxide reductase MsrA [Candidatus Woesearchaeota archaeon]|nr:peptide-methionine (S)-S-oxide reductase MsrA [Candidatus Woesearchaeota archaeon]